MHAQEAFASPQVTPTSPKVTFASPQVTPSSPKVTFASPQVTPSSPKVTFTSPKVTFTSPKVTSSSPKVTPSSYKVIFTSPKVTSSSPKVTSSSPKVTFISPQVTPSSPKVTFTSPKVTPSSSKVTSTSPKVASAPFSSVISVHNKICILGYLRLVGIRPRVSSFLMLIDFNTYLPELKLALLADGEVFGSEDTYNQATQTHRGPEKYALVLELYGVPLDDMATLAEARDMLSAAGFGRDQAKAQKKTLLVSLDDAERLPALRGD
jgi:hypothetical protein